MNVLASTGPFQHILGLNLDLCALLRLFQLFPLKLTVWVFFLGGGGAGDGAKFKIRGNELRKGSGGRERGMSLWDMSGIVSKIWQMIVFLPSLHSPTSAEISSLL